MKNLQLKQNQLPKIVYLLVTNDKYEFPCNVGDTLNELSVNTGFPYNILLNSLYHGYSVYQKYKVVKVDIQEPDVKFEYDEFRAYCIANNLSPSNFKSLELFKKYCYGEI